MRGCDLSRHYYRNTDWDALDNLYKCVGDTALEEELTKVGEHTAYMFRHKHSKTNMPNWTVHKQDKNYVPTAGKSAGAGKAKTGKTLMDYFGGKKNTSSEISGTPVSPSKSHSRSSSRSPSPSLLASDSENVDDDSEVTFTQTQLLDGPLSHGEDKRLDGEHVDDPQPDTLPDTLPMEDNEPVATDCPEILPELLDVKMEEEGDVEGSGEQDSVHSVLGHGV